jgi:hypothetical protein
VAASRAHLADLVPRRAPAAARVRVGRRSAFTLLELLLVMGLLGLFMGVGVGVLSSMNLGERAALGLVQNVVRSARNSALARGAPARVRIDPTTGTISAEALEVIGTWHFEETGDQVRGAFDLDGACTGAVHVDDGFIGKALALPSGARVYASVPVHLDPSYDIEQGFRIECVVRLEKGGGGRVLRLGETVGIDVSDGGALKAWFVPKLLDTNGKYVKGGLIAANAPTGSVVPGRWTRVAIEYDRRRFTIALDGLAIEPEDGFVEEVAPVWIVDSALVFGELQSSFVGALDCVTISAVVASETIELPGLVRFDPASPATIRFDAGGNLDREVHKDPPQLRLIYEDGRAAAVRVGMYGTVE